MVKVAYWAETAPFYALMAVVVVSTMVVLANMVVDAVFFWLGAAR